MNIKIEIKQWVTGSLLFEFECQGNTIKKTVEEAVRLKKDLSRADLSGVDLSGADLSRANLSRAILTGAILTGAKLRDNEKIKIAAVFTGLYEYVVIPYITELGEKRVKMGCHNRSVTEWESGFWNNNNEFPNNNSLKSNLRWMAFQTAKNWFEVIEKSNP